MQRGELIRCSRTMAIESVTSYFAAQPVAARQVLRRVREAIRTALPGADERISYQIPAYALGGKTIVYFAGWKKHYSVYPVTREVLTACMPQLAVYKIRKGTVRFPYDAPVPVKLIAKIARTRAREVSGRRSRLTAGSRFRARSR